MFSARQISSHTMRQRLQQRGGKSVSSATMISMSLECRVEKDSGNSKPNNKARYKNGTLPSFQRNSASAYNILKIICVSAGSETTRHLFLLNIGIGVPSVIVCAVIEYTTLTYTVRIDGNFNADRYISDILRPVVVSHLRRQPNSII